jgi:hypothetical protein
MEATKVRFVGDADLRIGENFFYGRIADSQAAANEPAILKIISENAVGL